MTMLQRIEAVEDRIAAIDEELEKSKNQDAANVNEINSLKSQIAELEGRITGGS